MVGVVVKPYLDAARELRAVQRLEKNWKLLKDADAYLDGYATTRKPSANGDVQLRHWSHWPAHKLFGKKNLSRIEKLRLVSPLNDQPSLQELSKLDFVTHLQINQHRKQSFAIGDEDCRHIAGMKNLEELVIGVDFKEGLRHFRSLPLTKLSVRGSSTWQQLEFDAIGDIESLQSIYLTTNKIIRENLVPLKNLKNLSHLILVTSQRPGVEEFSIEGLAEIAELPNLKSIVLYGRMSSHEIDALASMKQLETVDIQGGGWSDSKISILATYTRGGTSKLRHASFGYMKISVETYDKLVDAGIEVEHLGLTNAELSEEYFAKNKIYYPVDASKSNLTAYCKKGSETAAYFLQVKAAPKPRHDWSAILPPYLQLYGFAFSKNWQELVGFKKSITTDWDDVDADAGGFYDGIHCGTNNHELEFVSRKGDQFRIKWSCKVGDSADDSVPCEIDAHIPFTSVYVTNYQYDITLEAASKIVAKHFDLKEFEQPRFTSEKKTLIEFKLKQQTEPSD